MLFLALTALALPLAPKPAEDPEKKPAAERLIVKGDGYLVHVVRTGVVARGPFGESSYNRDVFNRDTPLAITHVNTSTGKMTRLASGGAWGASVEMAVNRDFRYTQHIWGIAHDAEHLYLVLARKLEVTKFFGGAGQGIPTATAKTTVQVFRLKDAELVQELDLPPADSRRGQQPDLRQARRRPGDGLASGADGRRPENEAHEVPVQRCAETGTGCGV
jgi:hypothetical protein